MIERLYPEPGSLDGQSAVYADVELACRRMDGLPFVYINMVSSIDGKVSVSGKSGAIGSKVDRETMRELRAKADAVMVGSGTVRAETVSLTTEGRSEPEPLAVIVSNSLDLPLKENLKDALPERTLIVTTSSSVAKKEESELEEIQALAKLIECEGSENGGVDLRDAMRRLAEDHGVRNLLLEGGPGLNRAMISAGLVSEVFMTLSPQLLGGNPEESLNIVSGNLFDEPIKADLISAHKADSELFLRYRIENIEK